MTIVEVWQTHARELIAIIIVLIICIWLITMYCEDK